jgi:hypothetical protein
MARRNPILSIAFIFICLTACTLRPVIPPDLFPPSPTPLSLPPTPSPVIGEPSSTNIPIDNGDLLPIYTRALSDTIWVDPYAKPYKDITAQVEVRVSQSYDVQSDVDGDGDEDRLILVNFIRATGGEFSELAYLVNEGGTYTSTQSILIGEQVLIQAVTLEDNNVVVELYTHGQRDFLCCPTALAQIRYEFDGTLWHDRARTNPPASEIPLGATVGLTVENVRFATNGFARHPILQLLPGSDRLPSDQTGSAIVFPERLHFTFGETRSPSFYAQPEMLVYRHNPTPTWDKVPLQTWLADESTEPYFYPHESEDAPPLLLYQGPLFLAAQPAYFDFGSGVGMRYLAVPGMHQSFSSYDEVLYIYKGLTADEQHEILFIYPLNHPTLDTLLPLGQTDNMEAEVQVLLEQVNLTAEGDLADTIAMLDAFVTSIVVQP